MAIGLPPWAHSPSNLGGYTHGGANSGVGVGQAMGPPTHIQSHPYSNTVFPDEDYGATQHPSLTGMVAMRMRWSHYKDHSFAALRLVRDGDRVFAFVLNAGQEPVILQDDYAMFPSDQFISALRLLEGK